MDNRKLIEKVRHAVQRTYAGDPLRDFLDEDEIVDALHALSALEREGWALVPREATAEMVQAMEDRQIEGASYIAENSIQFALWKEVWKAALAAAPKG